jgi:hypothetical protein
MDSPMHWLWARLAETLTPDAYSALCAEFEAYQREYGRAQRHQAKLDRLARLKELLNDPSSNTFRNQLQRQIERLTAHLEIKNSGTIYTDEQLQDVYVRDALSNSQEEEAR